MAKSARADSTHAHNKSLKHAYGTVKNVSFCLKNSRFIGTDNSIQMEELYNIIIIGAIVHMARPGDRGIRK